MVSRRCATCFRHLTQVARDKTSDLPEVFAERQGTVESSIDYLETLAANYAKLSPQSERKATDVNAVVRDTIGASGSVRTKLGEGLPPVSADALVFAAGNREPAEPTPWIASRERTGP